MKKCEIDASIKIRKIEDLIDGPMYVYVNRFNEEAAKAFASSMLEIEQRNQPVVPIIIDSYGGEVYSLLSMVDVIKGCKKPVATIVLGKAMSCGAILFTMGNEGLRFVGPNATLMIHDVSSSSFGKVEEVKSDSGEVERLNQHVYKMMARNCGKHENYFLDIVHEKGHADWYITPDEALKHNLASAIRIPEFNTKISVDIKFA